MGNIKTLNNTISRSRSNGSGRYKKNGYGNGNENGRKQVRSSKFLFEPIEPRLLLSSDLVFAGTAAFDLTLKYDQQSDKLQLIDNATSTTVLEQNLGDTSAVKIHGSSEADKLTIDFSSPFQVAGGIIFDDATAGDNDTLQITGKPSTNWNITGHDSGSADDGIQFSGIENLTGGGENEDTFAFEPGGSLTGVVDGGLGGFDSLVLKGAFNTIIFTPSGPNSGTVSRDGDVTTYAGLEPVNAGDATNVIFNGTAGVDDWVLEDSPTAGQIQVRSTSGSIETTSFNNPTSLTINLDSGNDTMTLASLGDSGFSGSILVNGQADNDTVDLSGALSLVKFFDGSAIATDGSLAARIVNVENFSGVSSTITEQGMPEWLSQGPSAITGGQTKLAAQNNPVIGSVNQVAADPFDPNVLFAATVGGGVWRNNDRTIFFATGSSTLDATSTLIVNEYAAFLKKNPGLKVQVNGYTDNTPNLNPGGNQQLSLDRANAVANQLIAQGVQASQLVVTGKGETDPIAPNDTPADLALNRRTEIIANHWTPLTDTFASTAIGSISISPLDASGSPVTAATPLNKLVLYAGTGTFSSNRSGGAAIGLLKSTDGGNTWTLQANSDLRLLRITSIVATGLLSGGKEIVLVSAMSSDDGSKPGGIFRSTDGGVSFTSLVAGSATALVVDPGKADRFYAAVKGQGIFISDGTDGGTFTLTTTQPSNAGANGANADRITLSVQANAGNASNAVFASLQLGSTLTGVFRSTDQGGVWTQFCTVPVTGGQADFDMSLQASADGAMAFIGGAAQAASPFVGVLQIGDGTTWNSIVLANANNTAPHADSRALNFDSAGRLIDTDDGGIYRLSLPFDATSRTWSSVNGDLVISEILSLAYDPLNNVFIAGNQDTGSSQQAGQPTDPVDLNGDGLPDDFATRAIWQQIMQADGQGQLAVKVDATHELRFSMSNNFRFFVANLFDSAGNIVPASSGTVGLRSDPTAQVRTGLEQADLKVANSSAFQTIPYVVNAVNSSKMLIGFFSLYESTDRLNTIKAAFSSALGANVDPNVAPDDGTAYTALAYGGKKGLTPHEDVIYAARGTRLFVREAGHAANDFTAISIAGSGKIISIVMDPDDWETAYATDGLQVYKTSNHGVKWDPISQNLVTPVKGLKTLEIVKAGADTVLLVGTRAGVYRAINPAPDVSWVQFGQGLPNAVVADLLFVDRTGPVDVLAAATQGRGAWTVYGDVATTLDTASTLTIDGTAGSDTFTLKRNAGNPLLVEISVNSATPLLTVPLKSIQGIVINGGGGADTIIIDSSSGPLGFSDGITFDGDTGDTLELDGGKYTDLSTTSDASTTTRVVTDEATNQTETIKVGKNATLTNNLTAASDIAKTGGGIDDFIKWLDQLVSLPTSGGTTQPKLALLDTSLFDAIMGLPLSSPAAEADSPDAASANNSGANDILGFLRLISSGNNAFDISNIGSSIASFADLAAKLDALDNVSSNTFVDSIDPEKIHFGLVKNLEGQARLDAEFNFGGGNVTLDGDFDLSAQVTVNMVFGVDGTGFYIDTTDAASDLGIDHISISGAGHAAGRFGFLDVGADVDSLTVDSTVGLAVNLSTAAVDKKLRLTDLAGSLGSDVSVSATGNHTNDIALKLDVKASALIPGIDSIDLGGAQLTIDWADVTSPSSATITANAGFASDVLDFLKVNTQQVRDEIAKLTKLSDALHVDIPFVSNALGDVLDLVNFIDSKVVNPLSSGGSASFPSAQNLATKIVQSLGIDPTTLGFAFDAAKELLTYHLHLTQDVLNKTVHLGNGLNLAQGLADLNFSTDGSADANVTLDLTLGIDIAAIVAGKPADQWFFIQNASASGSLDLTASNINASARFGFLSIEVFDGSITANSGMSITLKDPGTDAADGRIDIAELLEGLTHLDQLVSANITGSAEMDLPIKAPFLGITSNTKSLDNTLVVELPDFTNFKTATVQIPDAIKNVGNFANMDAASFVGLMGQVTGWLDQFRHSDTFAKFDVPLIGPALDKVLALNTAFRDAILYDQGKDDVIDGADKLATDVNAALKTAGLDAKLHAEISGGKIELIANDFSGTSFTVTAALNNELGFGTSQSSAGDPVSVTAANAAPSNGQLSADSTFTVTFNGGSPVDVTVHKSDTTDNTGLGDDHRKLVDASNAATFSTVDEMALRVAQILGISNALAYNNNDQTLAFTLALNPIFGSIDNLPLNFNLDLKPLLQLTSNSMLSLSADGTLNLTVGAYLGTAPSSSKLDPTKPLSGINGGVQNKTDLVITGTQVVRTVLGQISGDASFDLSVNGGNAHTVTVSKAVTLDNATAGDLVADINTALSAASLGSQIQAVADGNRVVLTGLGGVTAIHLSASNANPAVTEIGFASAQDAVNDNGTYKIKATKDLVTLYGRLTGDAAFDVTLNSDAPVTVTVKKSDTDTNRYPFDIVNDVQAAIDATALKDKVTAGFANNRLTLTAPGSTTFSLTASGPAATELGLGTTNTGNSNEFTITTRDGSKYGINLDGLIDLDSLLAAIGTQTSGKVTATLNDRQTGINLTDATSGGGTFKVEIANNSSAATTLGILRADAQQGETPDGLIEGADIAGLTPGDRFFLQNVNASVGLHLSTPGGIDLTAHLGFLGIELTGNATINASLGMALKDPGTTAADGRISLTELFNGLSDISTLLDAPSLTGGGDISLGVVVNPSIPGLTISADPLVLHINSFGDPFTGALPDVSLTVPDDLVAFNNPDFSFQNILEGLKSLAGFLGQFQSFGFLSEPIPLVNVSIKDLINLADKFSTALDQANADPAGTVQVLQDKLKEAFGIPKASNLLTMALFIDPHGAGTQDDQYFLRFTIDLSSDFNKSLSVNMALGSGLSLGGSAGFNASGNLDAKLDFGIDLHNPTEVDIFGGTGITAGLTASGNALNFKAALGPAGIFVKDGSAAITVGVTGGVDNLSGDQHISLSDVFTNGVHIDPSGSIHSATDSSKPAILPVYFPTESKHAGDITFDWQDITVTDSKDAKGPHLVVPDNLLSIDPSQFSLLDQLSLGVDGIDLFLGGLQDAFDGSIGGVKLPLIGDKLSGAAQVIGDFRNDFIDPLRQAIDDFSNPAADFAKGGTDPISKILYHLLGPKNQGGLGLLLDSNNDNAVGPDDIVYAGNINDPNVSLQDFFLNWHFKLGQPAIDKSAGIGFDIGIPGLGLETRGNVDLQIGWSLNFGFGLDYTNGFYIDVSPQDELKLDVDVSIPGGGITGNLGFLQLTADDHAANPTHLGATFGVDIFNSNDSQDDKLSFGELGDLGISAGIAADAVVDLDARLALSSQLVPNAATNFPSLEAEFVLDWGLGDRGAGQLVSLSDLHGNFLTDGLNFVGFKNVGLDLGSYFSDFIEPIAKKIQEYTAPIKPFLDFLTAPIPIISQLAGDTSLLDIAATTGAVSPEFISAIEFVDKIVDITNELVIPNSGNILLKFGDGEFDIFNSSKSMTFDLTDPSSITNALDSGMIKLPSWADLGGLQNALDAVAPVLKDAINSMTEAAGAAPKTTLKLPILNDPSQVFGMLLGKPAVLLDLDLAPFDLKAEFSAFFSLLGPLGVSINGDFDMHIKFDFGYDTLGVQEFASGGFKNPALIFDGFFVNDLDSTGKDVPELTFDAGIWAAAELNLAIARGGVGGGLFAEINFDLHDPNKDGKVRIDELVTDILNEARVDPVLAPLAIFDISGDLEARLFAFVKVDLFLFSLDESWDIVKPITLLKFDNVFKRYPTLATELGDGVLQLNMGPNSAQRIEGDLTDSGEEFHVKQGSDANHVLVWAPGLGVDESDAQEYEATKTILAFGGAGDDTIDASGVTANIDFDLEGDAGIDTIKAGSGSGHAKVLGGAGDDHLWGGGGDDILFGEAGADEIHGGGGNDLIFGDGDPKNSIQDNVLVADIKASDGDDTIFGDAGDDVIFGSGGIDTIGGGADNDTIIGDGGKVTIDDNRHVLTVEQTDKGKGGNDVLSGDAGNDLIYGGPGNDTIDGGADNDTIYGESGFDIIDGGSGDDIIHGGADDDTVNAGAGADTVYGEAGNDTINGGDNADWLYGGEGTDIIHGNGGNDHLFGNGGSDQLSGDADNDYLEGGGGDDFVRGDAGNDMLVGGYGSDNLDGGEDGDSYQISSRGGDIDQLTIAYDSGTLGTDAMTVQGTGLADTYLLRAMADYYYQRYYPIKDNVKDALATAFNDGTITADKKLDALKQAVTDAYFGVSQMFNVPLGMLDALTTQYNATPNNLGKLKQVIDDHYIEEGLALLDSFAESVFNDPAVAGTARVSKIEAAITEAYNPVSVPSGMFEALEAADPTDLSALEKAISTHFVPGTLNTQTAFVALLNNGGAHVERFNYRNMEGLALNTAAGDDYVVLDDVIAATTINLGLGNDRVQVGQVFSSNRVGNFDKLITNIDPVNAFGTLAITRGWLSDGVSVATTINGSDGNDEFTVFRNTAVLNLNGGDGDDLFTIRAFALAGSTDSERARTDLKGDAGADTVLYAVNAPVNIDGGDGFDTVRVVGTEFSDDFVVTDKGVFGAGLNINYVNIEKLVADGAEGNDRFFILSTGTDVVTEVDGGLGSDSFFVGGTPQNGPIPVISNDFKGYSSIIEHSVTSTDPLYDGIRADGISANVVDKDEPFIIVTESGGISRVTEDATSGGEGWEYDTYTVRLSRAPAAGLNATINVVPSELAPEDEAKGFKNLEFFDVVTSTWVVDPKLLHPLVFTGANWNMPQTVKFRAVHDDASEGTRFCNINHTTSDSTDPDYANAKMLSVKVQINDDDKAGVLVTPSGLDNTVLEGGFTDSYQVVLTRQPKKPDGTSTDVTVVLGTINGQVTLSSADVRFNALTQSITFNSTNYNDPVNITITAKEDTVVEGFHTDFITYSVSSSDVDTDVPVASYLVNGDFDLGDSITNPLEIPFDKPTSYLFLRDKPDLTQPVTVLYDADGAGGPGGDVTLSVFDANDESQQSDNILRYSITGNTLTFYKNGNSVAISGAVHISYSYIKPGYDNAVVKDSVVDIYDNDSAAVIVRQSDNSTDVLENGYTDTYKVQLSRAPESGKTVTVHVDSVKTRTTLGSTAYFLQHVTVDGVLSETLTFDEFNWNSPQTVTVAAINDTGTDAIVEGDDTQVFAPELQTTHKIRGPIILQGAAGSGSLSLPSPLMLPGEKNIRPFDGQVVSFTAVGGQGSTEFMTVKKADLVAKLPSFTKPTISDIFGLVGKTIEVTEGPGTGVVLDPTRPRDLFNRFWLINQVVDNGDGSVTLALQNPSAVDPSLPNITAPTSSTKYAVTSLSVNFFADERKTIDYTMIFDDDSVADENGALTSSTGNVLGFTPSGGSTETMTVKTADLQAIASLNNNLNLLLGRTLEITVGPGLARVWTISALGDGAVAGTKLLTLTKVSGSGTPTDRSEFRVAGGDTRGRVTGFGMGPNVIIGGVQSGAITYGDMEVFQMSLGKGNDHVRIDYTTNAEDHTTKRSGDFYTLSMLNTGAGNDNVTVKLLNGSDGDFALNLGAGDDTADASASTLPLTVFGWDGKDTITGGAGADTLFGDIGRVDYLNSDGAIVTRLGFSEPLNEVNPPVGSATATTLTDTITTRYDGHAFATEFGGLVGLIVQVISPDGHVQYRRIIANTQDTITIDHPWDSLPIFGNADPKDNSAYRVSTVPEDQTDGTFRGPRLVWSVFEDTGGDDHVNGGGGNDLIVGGAGNDTIDAGAGNNLVAGDDARFEFTPVSGNDGPARLVRIIDPGTIGDDILTGGPDTDLLIGGLGKDTISGGSGNDILIGDAATVDFDVDGITVNRIETTNRASGGVDTIYGGADDDVLIGGTNADNLDGGLNQDLIFGDNVLLVRNAGSGNAVNPRFRALTGTTIYDSSGLVQVAGPQSMPGGLPAWGDWTITLDQTMTAANFGNDYIAGGGGSDEIFGQLGNDTIQGDGSIDFVSNGGRVGASRNASNALVLNPSFDAPATDGSDYIEGNGGNDVIFGNLGQDDIIGGSSSLFSLTTPDKRPDGQDLIFGGSGLSTRNDVGDTSQQGHANDADAIVGDNGNIYRLVGVNGTPGGAGTFAGFLAFNYDNYTNGLPLAQQAKIVVRAIQLVDYTPGGPDYVGQAGPLVTGDIGAADEIHGDGGDDFIYGMAGNDVLFGDGQNDSIIGGYGNDWISGGTGDDGILGDDGRIFSSRNSTSFGEPLYGIAAISAANINRLDTTNNSIQVAILNVNGLLKYTADLTPDNLDSNHTATPSTLMPRPTFANDIIYGGLGTDSIHGGAGEDAISGAEALAGTSAATSSYTNNYDQNGNQLNPAPIESDYAHPFNPGNPLGYNPATTKFALYDANDGLRKILLTATGGLSKTASGLEWLLNFNATEGPLDTKWFVGTGYPAKPTDGDDHIFGDLGHDWLVGGTGRDSLWGGWGDDVLNMDDVLTTHNTLNDQTDTNPSWEDLAFGGAGRDVLILNTNGDRAVDWTGEFNSYWTPFNAFGAASVIRLYQPDLRLYLLDVSESQGADPTLAAKYGSDPVSHGEPFGEIGLVTNKDAAWQDQNGSPRDPQAGNSKGKTDIAKTTNNQPLYETAEGPAPATVSTDLLTDAELAPIVAEAKLLWEEALGAGDSRLGALNGVQVEVGNLSQDRLGATIGNTILIDTNAAGYGWFIDPTPATNTEFAIRHGSGLFAAPSSAAFGEMDLLTVVLHEFGHVLGYTDLGSNGNLPGIVMDGTLDAGERLLPNPVRKAKRTANKPAQERHALVFDERSGEFLDSSKKNQRARIDWAGVQFEPAWAGSGKRHDKEEKDWILEL